MGLKKENYQIEKLGLTLPVAYAILHRLEVCGDRGFAEFRIQNSPRENALGLKPLDVVNIEFAVDRNENPFVTAYREAKKVETGTYLFKTGEFDEKGKEIVRNEAYEIRAPFADWEDDIV